MDHEFEFVEEIKETEAERLQRLVRTTDSVSLLQYVRRRAMRLAVQTGDVGIFAYSEACSKMAELQANAGISASMGEIRFSWLRDE